MAASLIADSSFLVALLSSRERDHDWADAVVDRFPPPWIGCEAVLAEAFYLLGEGGRPALAALLARGAIVTGFSLGEHLARVLNLMDKYANVPMSFADACMVRMSETLADPVVLTLDADFGVYRRHGRQVIPFVSPDHPQP
ncbi:MAG TPA: PIN domain-containing protein [Thermoanaerobaculia bacterium]|nr:PIN domain-containing protein [Thermoanaerobaculia bacterium]